VTQGPNVKKLIVRLMSNIMVPPGGGLADALNALIKPGNIGAVAKQATELAEAMLALAKTADPNPYGDDDEAIAAEILRGVAEKEKARR
jgi:hypothetical protein